MCFACGISSVNNRSQRPSEYHLAFAGALTEHSPSTRRALAGVRPWTAFPWKATPGKSAISITVSSAGCKAMHIMSQPSNNIRRQKNEAERSGHLIDFIAQGGHKGNVEPTMEMLPIRLGAASHSTCPPHLASRLRPQSRMGTVE